MAVYSVTINPGSNSQPASIYGTKGWTGNVSYVEAPNLLAGEGSTWIIWQIGALGIPSGQSVNAVVVNGSNWFNVNGGTGTSRYAYLHAATAKTLAGITGGGSLISQPLGTGANLGISANLPLPGGLTSTDLLAGSFFVGYSVSTDNTQPGLGPGVYHNEALSFTFYTGSDVPVPPGGQNYQRITNPTANSNPGKFPSQQFAALTWDFTPYGAQNVITVTWTLSSPYLTFAATGTQTQTFQKGPGQDPANPYNCTTSLINIAANTPGGLYTIKCVPQFYSGPPSNIESVASLKVQAYSLNGLNAMFMEF